MGLVPDLGIPEHQHREAGSPEGFVASLVGLPVEQCAVVPLAVDLHQQGERWIREVHPADPSFPSDIHLSSHRLLTSFLQDPGEPALETAGGRHVTRRPLSQDLSHDGDAVPTMLGELVEQGMEASPTDETHRPGVVAGPRDPQGMDLPGQLEEHQSRRGDRDTVEHLAVLGREEAGQMNARQASGAPSTVSWPTDV